MIRIIVALNPQRVIPVVLRFMFLSTQAQEQQHTSKSNLTFLSQLLMNEYVLGLKACNTTLVLPTFKLPARIQNML